MIWPTKKQYIPVSRTDIKLCFPNKVWEELTGMIDRFQCSKVSHLLPILLFTSSSKLTLALIHIGCQWTLLAHNLRCRHLRAMASCQAKYANYQPSKSSILMASETVVQQYLDDTI